MDGFGFSVRCSGGTKRAPSRKGDYMLRASTGSGMWHAAEQEEAVNLMKVGPSRLYVLVLPDEGGPTSTSK